MIRYTFRVLGKDGKARYPMEFKWQDQDCPSSIGLLDFDWTENVKEAITWDTKDDAETIAIEIGDTKVIEVEEPEIVSYYPEEGE